MKNWEDVKIAPEFNEQGVACYRLTGADFLNEYYIISEAETRKLLNTPEIVGYEVYNCLISSTSQMLYYLKEQKKVTTANILSILRGALNYPLEESCYREHIRVHDISFLSSERVFENEEIAGLEIKYSKLTMVPDSTLMIGDIIASGETLIHCLRYVTDFYREHGAKLRNIIIFTIGGTKGIDILEDLTRDIREFWPEFEGFITVYYEGIFATYQDKGVSGINLPDVDFYWKGGIVARFFRNYPFLLLFVYLNFASSNCLPQRPYIDLFIIFNLLLVPSTKPLLKLYATAFSTASISRFNPSAKLFSALILLLLYFSTNK